ncbi:hypothetical protein BESB_079670 [Besnoitia besnoiti]|uniref:BTB domain-containing protein n=1 Tax=Besnoitia besnoiti TaxID=94643 RepID=A0A2A9MBR0_BESBE|nr:hypothetical protein BESB_079670 [Besnoitia besnoiti]PFH33751.1 hypothetical protein BESB_079670 [Besnoitia besnoiti]
MYGALNDAIRAILRRYRRTVVIHQDRYSQFIRALFTSCPLSDCTITIGGELPLSARFYGPLALSAPSPSSPLPAADLPSPAAPSGVRSASPRTQQVACGFPAVSDASWPWRGDDAEDWFVLVDRLSLPRGNADHLTQIGGAGPGCIPLNRRHASHGHAASSFIQEHRSRGFSGQDSRGERRRSRAYRPFGAMRRSRRSPSQRLIKKDSDRTARADSRSASLLSLLFERNIRPLSLRRPSARHLSRGLSGAAPPPRYEADQPADRGGAPQRRLERLCSMQNESYYSSPAPDSAHPSSLAFHRPARGSVASVSYRQADSFSSRVQASDQAQDRPESSFFPHGSRSTSLPAFSFASLPGRACRSTEASEDPRFLPHVSGSLESSSPVSTCDPAAGPAPDGRRPLSLDFVSQILRNPYVAALPVHAVRLAPDATVVNAHKLILACRSPFFHEELSKSYCLSRSLLNIPLSRGGNSRASKAPRGPGASHGANEHGEGRRQIPGGADVCGGAAAHMAGLGFRVRRSSETSPDRSLSCNPNVASVQRPAACSPVAELLKSHPSMLLQLIRYLYADEVEIPLKDVSAFVKLAKAFRLEDLWKRVEEEKTCIDSHMHRQSSRKVLAAPQTLGLSPRKDFPAILAGDLRSAVVSIFRHAEKQLHAIQLAQEKAPRSSRSDGDDGGGGSAGRCQKPRRGRHETSGGAAERPANGMWRGAGRSRNIHGKRGMEQTATESDELEDSRGGHREERQGLTLSVDSQEPEAKAEVIPSGCAEELGEKRARQLTHDEDLTFKNQSQHSTEEGGAQIKQEQTQGEAQTTKPRGVKERGEDRTPHLSLSGMTEERAAAGDQQNRKETCKASLEAGAEKQEPGGDCGKNEGFVDVFLSCADLCVYVGASQTPFPCHRFIVEKRSEYLATLLHSSFREVKVPPPCPVVLDGTLSPLDLSSCARPRAPGDRCLENSSSPLSSAPSSFLSSETRPPYLPAAASSASRCPLRSCPPSSSASSAVSSSAPYSSVSPPCVASTSCSRTSPPSPSRLDSTPSSLSVRSPVAASFQSLPSPLPPCRLISPVIAASSVSDSSACCASTVSAGSVNSTRAPLRRRTSHSPPHPLQGEPARSSSLPSSSALLSVSSAAAARPAALPSPASKEEGTAQDARWTGR